MYHPWRKGPHPGTLYMRRHQQQQQQNAINLVKNVFINLIYVSSHFKQIKLVCSNRGLSTGGG